MIKQFISEKKSILLFLSLIGLLIIASFYLAEPALEEYPAYRVDSPAPDGTKAFYQSLETLSVPVERFTKHPNQLKVDGDIALFLFGPPLLMEQHLIDHYLNFVDRGGTIFIVADQHTELFPFNIEPVSLLDESGSINVDGELYQAELNSWIRLSPSADDQILITDDYGVIALSKSFGSGEIIQMIEPSWFTNELILAEDHLEIIASVLSDKDFDRLYFETYHYLTGTKLTVLDITPDPILLLGMILITLVVMYLWLKGKRFGPALSLREQEVRFGDERIRALANWQIKGRNFHEALMTQVNFLKLTIFERVGIPTSTDMSDYQQVLQRLLVDYTDKSIKEFIDQLEAVLDSGHVNKQEFLEWTKRIDQIQRRVEAK
ncbi:DUF4350 domain-containing protein [Amphibacillus xylanus]|uniref:DUF4350 domain-containing protein n=1 Tax=Amphibacillus xylanus (strain ATCC 51415 / DSM 6626 / JCM 7361 / LMG 17667 / NBRC 15112 / Ep01) TaxID=698758 RepID=K0J2I1_AMPXN|nr:DUF4350 domain-containing protein [Amphibacillus xylanus]BAM46716.1 hypothetical protein AXY_05840 [Amphibacillus xylanus NBRC 15112]